MLDEEMTRLRPHIRNREYAVAGDPDTRPAYGG